MNENSWRSILRTGKYRAELLDFTLSRSAGERFLGTGRLEWTTDSGITISGTTDGEGLVLRLMSGEQERLIPESNLFRLDAVTPDGWSVEVTGILATGYKAHFGRGVVWNFPVRTLILRQETRLTGGVPFLHAVLGPLRRMLFTGESEIVNRNPHETFTTTRKDWTSFNTSFGNVYLRKQEDYVDLQIVGELDFESLERALEAVRLSLGFIEGRDIKVLGTEMGCNSTIERRVLMRMNSNGNSFPSPLPQSWSGELMATAASEFFYSERGAQFANHLQACWSATDSYASFRTFAVCSSVEAMIGLVEKAIPEQIAPSVTTPAEMKESQVELLTAIQAEVSRYGERFVKRVKGIVDSPDQRDDSPKGRLNRWAAAGRMDVEREDAQAWDELRNPVSHGVLLFTERDKDSWIAILDKLARVDNLVNKFLLHAMNYKGDYFDHAHREVRSIR